MGTTRSEANCRAITPWVASVCCDRAPQKVAYEIIDLSEWNLPLFDEPGIPATAPPSHAHTRAWSRKLASLQGSIFVRAQHNWGYPAALKNALDFLHKEWSGKSAAVVTCGSRGGGKCAEQLQQALIRTGLRMHVQSSPVLKSITKQHQKNGRVGSTQGLCTLHDQNYRYDKLSRAETLRGHKELVHQR